MPINERFSISFLKTTKPDESMFVSVTSGFEHGPGIKRDGITPPRMNDPHSIPYICNSRNLPFNSRLPETTNAYIQRAGTWTLFHHLKEFHETLGDKWLIVGVQSCGDLTMNPWHIAYVRNSYIKGQTINLCGLLQEDGVTRTLLLSNI